MGITDLLFGGSKSKSGTAGKQGKKATKKAKQTMQDSIPYIRVFENGVIETKPDVYTKAYRLVDVNFKIAPDKEQLTIFQDFGSFLNSFPSDVRFQIVIQNHRADKHATINSVRFYPANDSLNRFRSEMNSILLDKVAESKNNLEQDKFLVVSVYDENPRHAMETLMSIETDVIDKGLRKIAHDVGAYPLTLEERLEMLFNVYNQDGESIFYNDVDEDGNQIFSLDRLEKLNIKTKDLVGPSGMEFRDKYFMLGNTYGCSMYLQNVPTWLKTEFITDLANLSCNLLVSMNFEPQETTKAIKLVRDQLLGLNAQIAGQQKDAARSGYGMDVTSPDLARSKEQVNSLMEDLVSRDQKLYYITFTVTTFAESKRMLEENKNLITTVANKHLSPIKTLTYQQEDGLNASLPLCVNDLKVRRMYTTESASVFIPYTSQEIFKKNGIYYGLNQTTDNLIVYSRLGGNNFNGLIFGASGAGKSFTAKCEMLSVMLRDENNYVYVIDPEGEYKSLAGPLKGEVVELTTSSNSFINPLDMDIDYGGDGDPVPLKTNYIISMIEIILGNGQTLNPQAKSIIDRCVQTIYRGYIEHIDKLRAAGSNITIDREAMPTLSNLYNELNRQQEDEAHTIAEIIELYAVGSLSTFSHRTSVNPDARFVVYDISKLGTGMKNLGLHICLNEVWNRMIENRKKGKWTWFYIDEFYLLLQSDSAASFLAQVWKRARKWHGVPTGIMQNTEDLLRNVDAHNIINNTGFVIMLDLPRMDRMNLSDLLQIPESQMGYITNAEPGHGLVYTGKTVLPFKNEFPKNTELYKIMSTSRGKEELMGKNGKYLGK